VSRVRCRQGIASESTRCRLPYMANAHDSAYQLGMGEPSGSSRSRRGFVALTAAACLVFAGYAGCFLYFFVDDEAIPLVYARNLLRGRGLIYTVLEGRSEGYSDFLHVVWSALLLYVTRTFHLSRVTPLLIGKVIGIAAGAGVIVVTARILWREGVRLPG